METDHLGQPLAQQKIRLVLCGYPGVFSAAVRQTIGLAAGIELVGLVHSTRIFTASENWLQGAMRMVGQSGLPYALGQFLQTDLFGLAAWALCKPDSAGVPVLATKNINGQDAREFLGALKPDVILLANFNQKLLPETIKLPRFACLNIHPSLLPRYKGVDPVFAALNAGEAQLGVTLHHVSPELDAGGLVAQQTIAQEAGRSVFFHQIQLFKIGADLAVAALKRLPEAMPNRPQTGEGSYESWPSKRQVRGFLGRGGRLVGLGEYLTAVRALLKSGL